jgi:Tol biopolymer transport system component
MSDRAGASDDLAMVRALILIGAVLAALSIPSAAGSSSPSGGQWLVFAGVRWSNCCVSSQIYVIRADGNGQRRITRIGAWQDTGPAWSHDGKRIAFERGGPHGAALYVMDAGGGQLHAITGRMSLSATPSWSPDGRSIVFAGMPQPPPSNFAQQLYITPSRGGGTRQVTRYSQFRGGAGEPAWSPSGRLILFWGATSSGPGSRTDVWSVRPNGSGPRRLIAGATDPAWSPDGERIAFVRDRQIYVATAAGMNARRLTNTPTEKSSPSWSPDGTRIAFSNTHRYRDPARDDVRLAIISAGGGGQREITDTNPNFWADAPAWQPAG